MFRLPEQSLSALIERHARDHGDRPYLEDARGPRVVHYAGLSSSVASWAAALEALGVPAGGLVVVDVGDPLDFAVTHLAVIAAGRRSVPVNTDAAWDDLVRLSGSAGGVHLVVTDRTTPGELPGAAVVGVDAAVGGGAGIRPPGDDGAALLFTSGSTGEPKGVELPEAQLMFVARAVAEHNALTAADRGYNALPLFHVNAEVVGLLATLVAGATLVLDRRFHRTGFGELLAERRITWVNAVPAMLAVLARGGGFAVPPGVRFVRSASAPLPEAVRLALGDVPLVVSYGMTEAASQITAVPLGAPAREGSVGVPVGCELEVRDDGGVAVPAGEVGMLWIRGPGVVTGYFGGRAADRFDPEGWLATGDLGRLDADGWVYLVGRSDDVINRGGEKVYPSEVEDVLLRDARVREAIVVARPDEILHQVPVAYVIPIADDVDRARLVAELAARCERELPRFKRPAEISVVDDVPRAPTGKVQRARVRALAAEA